MARIGIIGGGLAGLIVAFRRAVLGDRVTIFEASARLGGQLRTERMAGFVIEHGAEGYVARSAAVPRLAGDLGIAAAIVAQAVTTSYSFDGKTLVALLPGEAAAALDFQVEKPDVGAGIRSFVSGMGTLTDALENAISRRVVLHLSTPAIRISRGNAACTWHIVPETCDPVEVDHVVVATPHAACAALLGEPFGEAARAMRSASTLSSVTVSLAYARGKIDHALDGTGFVVADPKYGFRACTFTSSKFPGRAPEGSVSVRLFFRPSGDELSMMTDEAWVARAEASLASVLPVRGPSRRAWVSRWPNALPVYSPEHVSRVRALDSLLAGTHVYLAGSAFHGSGIDAAVRSAEAVASALD